jgi:hypothetical protein
MNNPEKLATYAKTKKPKTKKNKKKPTQYVLDTTIRKQTQIT